MNQGSRVEAIGCRDCDRRLDPETDMSACPDCGGTLRAEWHVREDPAPALEGPENSMWAFDALLPFDRETAVSLGEGGTPLVSAPHLAADHDVDTVLIKDEGQNPTGSAVDRDMSVAVTAADQVGMTRGALVAPGAAGQSFAAYAARAGIDGSVYLPSRAPFDRKAMVNVHGIDLTVVRGRFEDAKAAFQSSVADTDLQMVFGAFESGWRPLGGATIAYELVADLDGSLPDVVVIPTGTGSLVVGIYQGFRQLQTRGLIDELPSLVAVQATGCAPITEAVIAQRSVEPVTHPDTICGELEVPNPRGVTHVREAIERTGGTAVSVTDEAILKAAVSVARQTGIELGPSAGAAPAGFGELTDGDLLDSSSTVVLISSGTGGADVLRNHVTTGDR